MDDKDPFKEFGGTAVESAPKDPFSEFGGQEIATNTKKNFLNDPSNGGTQTNTSGYESESTSSNQNNPPSDFVRKDALKSSNQRALQVKNSDVIKQRMVDDFAKNPNGIYQDQYIDNLSKKGYNKDVLNSYKDEINAKNAMSPEEAKAYLDKQVYGDNVLGSIRSKVDDYIVNNEDAIKSGAKQTLGGIVAATNPYNSLEDKGTGVLNAGAGALKAGFGALSLGNPELIAFNTATEAVTSLPESAKSKIIDAVSPLPKDAQGLRSEKDNAQTFDKVVNLPFSAATTLATELGYNPEDGSAGKAALEILNLAIPIAGMKGGKVISDHIKSIDDLKNIQTKVADGKATPEEEKALVSFGQEVENIPTEEIKTQAGVINKDVPNEQHSEQHDKVAELQSTIKSPEFSTLPPDLQQNITEKEKAKSEKLVADNANETISHLNEAHQEADIAQTKELVNSDNPVIREAAKEKLKNIANDSKNITRVQGNEREGQEPVAPESDQSTGTPQVSDSRMVQSTPEEDQLTHKEMDDTENKVSVIAQDKGVKLTPEEIGDVAHIHLDTDTPISDVIDHVVENKDNEDRKAEIKKAESPEVVKQGVVGSGGGGDVKNDWDKTQSDFLAENKKELGDLYSDNIESELKNEHYNTIEKHIRGGGKISEGVYNSLSDGQRYNFDKQFGSSKVDKNVQQTEQGKKEQEIQDRLISDAKAKKEADLQEQNKKEEKRISDINSQIKTIESENDLLNKTKPNQKLSQQDIDNKIKANNSKTEKLKQSLPQEVKGKVVGSGVVDVPKEFTAKGKNKVVDDKGNPIVLYHGTHKDFTGFDPNFDYENIPDAIGQIRDYETPYGVVFLTDNSDRTKSYGGKTVPVIIRAKKVLKIDAGKQSPDRFFDDDYNGENKIWTKFEEGGYDAIEISGETPKHGKVKTYITFPEQIKAVEQPLPTQEVKGNNNTGKQFADKIAEKYELPQELRISAMGEVDSGKSVDEVAKKLGLKIKVTGKPDGESGVQQTIETKPIPKKQNKRGKKPTIAEIKSEVIEKAPESKASAKKEGVPLKVQKDDLLNQIKRASLAVKKLIESKATQAEIAQKLKNEGFTTEFKKLITSGNDKGKGGHTQVVFDVEGDGVFKLNANGLDDAYNQVKKHWDIKESPKKAEFKPNTKLPDIGRNHVTFPDNYDDAKREYEDSKTNLQTAKNSGDDKLINYYSEDVKNAKEHLETFDQHEEEKPIIHTSKKPTSDGYYILTEQGKLFKKVKGKEFPNEYGLDLFSHKNKNGGVTISEGRTGLEVSVGSTLEESSANLDKRLKQDNLLSKVAEKIRLNEEEFGTSPRYEPVGKKIKPAPLTNEVSKPETPVNKEEKETISDDGLKDAPLLAEEMKNIDINDELPIREKKRIEFVEKHFDSLVAQLMLKNVVKRKCP